MEQFYRDQYGDELLAQAKRSGLDPETFFALGEAGQNTAAQWGTNLPNATDIIAQQQAAYDARLGQQQATNSYIDEFGALQNFQSDNIMQQYLNGTGMAQARYDLGIDQLEQGYHTDRGILGQQRYRAVDLGRADNSAALLHNRNMRGVLDTSRGLIGQEFSDRQGYLNQQIGFINDRQNLAYDQFQSTDQYAAQQGKDLLAQYGFAGEQFAQQQEGLFADRSTSTRSSSPDHAHHAASSNASKAKRCQCCNAPSST